MSHQEFVSWTEFYRKWPFDDLYRYHRPAALIASRMSSEGPQYYLDWLAPPDLPPEVSSVDLSILRAFGVEPPGDSTE